MRDCSDIFEKIEKDEVSFDFDLSVKFDDHVLSNLYMFEFRNYLGRITFKRLPYAFAIYCEDSLFAQLPAHYYKAICETFKSMHIYDTIKSNFCGC